jgi:HemY protein
MIRVLAFIFVLAALAWGIGWIADQPGDVTINWLGYHADTSNVGVALGLLLLAAILLNVVWTIIRFVFKLPSLMSLAAKARRRAKGYAALSRGMVAAGAGDARTARKSAAEAKKHLNDEPLAVLLAAQAAQLSGDRTRAEAAFSQLAEQRETRLLGLRGLHVEAQRHGDLEAANHFALEAHAIAPLPWSAKAVLDHRAANEQWEAALAALESHIAAKLVDKKTGERQRAVLETAIALDKAARAPDEALRLAQAAVKRAPDLAPALALAARLLARRGDLRKAAKLVEQAWPRCAHPDLAAVYLDLRPGDSNFDRLSKAQTLMRLAPRQAESRLALARAALAARQFATARDAMAPLIAEGEQPTAGMCLIMAELENAEHGDQGQVRQWMARASRAPRDAVWMADGVIAANWAPASPVTGRLDAFVWQKPTERPGTEIAYAPGQEAGKDWTLDWVQAGSLPAGREPAAEAAAEMAAEEEAIEPAVLTAPGQVREEPVAEARPLPAREIIEPAKLDPAKPEPIKPESAKPEPAKPDAVLPRPAAAAVLPVAGNGAAAVQKVVFPLPGAPDDPGLEELDRRKKHADFF